MSGAPYKPYWAQAGVAVQAARSTKTETRNRFIRDSFPNSCAHSLSLVETDRPGGGWRFGESMPARPISFFPSPEQSAPPSPPKNALFRPRRGFSTQPEKARLAKQKTRTERTRREGCKRKSSGCRFAVFAGRAAARHRTPQERRRTSGSAPERHRKRREISSLRGSGSAAWRPPVGDPGTGVSATATRSMSHAQGHGGAQKAATDEELIAGSHWLRRPFFDLLRTQVSSGRRVNRRPPWKQEEGGARGLLPEPVPARPPNCLAVRQGARGKEDGRAAMRHREKIKVHRSVGVP